LNCLTDDELQHVAAQPIKVVIPGPPARADPGIQTLFSGGSGFRVALRLPGTTELRFVADQVELKES
jgi:hypothetical protein